MYNDKDKLQASKLIGEIKNGNKICQHCNNELVVIKNRFCCPKDNESLITILDKKVDIYEMKITCKSCNKIYKKEVR